MAEKIEFVIESGIPIPAPRTGSTGEPNLTGLRAALRSMDIGDSVFVPGTSSIAKVPGAWGALFPKEYTARSLDGGCRIWRIG